MTMNSILLPFFLAEKRGRSSPEVIRSSLSPGEKGFPLFKDEPSISLRGEITTHDEPHLLLFSP
jgi:hypothetical protein